MASSYEKQDIQLPYHLATTTTGTLLSDSQPKPVPEVEVRKPDRGKLSDDLVGSTFCQNIKDTNLNKI